MNVLQVLRAEGYRGGISALRALVRRLRPGPTREAFVPLTFGVAEVAQIDWGEFGDVLGIGRQVHAFVLVNVSDQSLVHEEHLRSAADVGVNRHREHGVIVFPIDPVKLIAPHLLDGAWINEAMAVGRFFNEHHGWQVVEVPVGRDLDEISLLPAHQRFHPLCR